jgi:hypothetical protein
MTEGPHPPNCTCPVCVLMREEDQRCLALIDQAIATASWGQREKHKELMRQQARQHRHGK